MLTKPKILQRQILEDKDGLPPQMHPILKRIYLGRGVSDVRQTENTLKYLLPFVDLKDIDNAVSILAEAIVGNKRILIVGDYDCDGATSCALAVRVLRAFGAKQVDYLVPNRFEYGYGLTPEIVALAKTKHPDLIVTVDNGIASVDGVAAAKAALGKA